MLTSFEDLTQSNAGEQRGDQPLNGPGNCTSQVLTFKNKLSVWESGNSFLSEGTVFPSIGQSNRGKKRRLGNVTQLVARSLHIVLR